MKTIRDMGLMAIGLALVMVAFLATCVSCAAFTGKSTNRVSDTRVQMARAVRVARLCITSEGMAVGFGSGVIYSKTEILTASHVVRCDGELVLKVVSASGDVYPVTVSALDERIDVARLKLGGDASFGDIGRVDVGSVGIGDSVCLAIGAPRRGYRCGIVSEWDSDPGNVQHGAVTEPGNSGSGVYSGGRLVGIVTHYTRCLNGQYCGGLFSSLYRRVP